LFRGKTKRWLWARWIFLTAALASFLLFLPISAAAIETSLAGFERLMWFASWR
jgi:dolichyl-phosphate-mannose--protein O-mannosyl transferase